MGRKGYKALTTRKKTKKDAQFVDYHTLSYEQKIQVNLESGYHKWYYSYRTAVENHIRYVEIYLSFRGKEKDYKPQQQILQDIQTWTTADLNNLCKEANRLDEEKVSGAFSEAYNKMKATVIKQR
jgi:hypothetical protein